MSNDADVRVVQTRQGDTIDIICQRYFGKTRDITEQVLAMNPSASSIVIFNSGESLKLPITNTRTTSQVISLWD